MSKKSSMTCLQLRGVRHNNLKGFDLDLPLGKLIVITGLSGSGKSSLAFDTLYAEGQRRYLETFSPYARQFFERMDKPRVDRIQGIPPAIAIEQRNTVRTTRSTVGTMTEICDYLKLLWPKLARLVCRGCGQPVRREPPQEVWASIQSSGATEVLITFELMLSEKLTLAESLDLVRHQGYQRLLVAVEGSPVWRILRLEEAQAVLVASPTRSLVVVQDRVRVTASARARIVEACEQAYHFGQGKLAIWDLSAGAKEERLTNDAKRAYSLGFHCARCDVDYREPTPGLFSFNHPSGACPTCRGFGRTIAIDYRQAIPNHNLTLAEGVVRPWQSGVSAECQQDLMQFCRRRQVPVNLPFAQLSVAHQEWVINGDEGYGRDAQHEWPHAWYGVKGYFRWLESKAYKMHVRVLLSRYRTYQTCPDCGGTRFQPETLLYRVAVPAALVKPGVSTPPDAIRAETSPEPRGGRARPLGAPYHKSASPAIRPYPSSAPEEDSVTEPSVLDRASAGSRGELTLADFYQLTVNEALGVVEELVATRSSGVRDPLGFALEEVRSRLAYLVQVGLGYLTLDRPTRSLSGGETERVNLTTCLGTRLVNTLFVLDEPSVGLHPRDTQRLVALLVRLRDQGNTVVVVEHEAAVIRAADQLVDLGPGHGEAGGHLVFQGSYRKILDATQSLTGQYLSGRQQIGIPSRRPVGPEEASPRREIVSAARTKAKDSINGVPWLVVSQIHRHNLRQLTVRLPLRRLVCITGVSGSGKTTLVREVLLPLLQERLQNSASVIPTERRLEREEAEDEREGVSGSTARLAGAESLRQVVLVDQSAVGRTPRSNPAVYIGAFDALRELYARGEGARQRGLAASAFSFNSPQGQCERCRGAGYEKIEMQFLSDVYIQCPECGGRRYRSHVLEAKLAERQPSPGKPAREWSISDMLEATVDESLDFLAGFQDSRAAQRAAAALRWLQKVGLGYLRLGQPLNTLSGGESQRIKLVRYLAEADGQDGSLDCGVPKRTRTKAASGKSLSSASPVPAATRPDQGTLFLFDEPTTGLHFDDIRVLLEVFQGLVDQGNSVVVIEHNLEVIKCADWVIDLGPEAGEQGGRIVAQGPPEHIARCAESHTGQFLRECLA